MFAWTSTLEIAALSLRTKTERCLFKDEERKQSKFSSTSHHFSQKLFFALSRTGFQSFLGPLQDFSSIIFNTAAKEKLKLPVSPIVHLSVFYSVFMQPM